MDGGLTGAYHVKPIYPALKEARKLWPRTKDRMEVRRHALKLKYWPRNEDSQVQDLDWEYIAALPGLKIGELRIDDTIGGQQNLRIIFFVDERKENDPLPKIWILSVIAKKRNHWTKHELEVFRSRRQICVRRSE